MYHNGITSPALCVQIVKVVEEELAAPRKEAKA